jgi:autotransporter-associated beta strand protein
MRVGGIGARATGGWRGGRIAFVAVCVNAAVLIARPGWTQTITLSNGQTFDVAPGQTETISSVLANGSTPGSLDKTDGGTLLLTAVNTYTGPTTIDGGTLALGGAGSIATSSGVALTTAGTVFDISGVNASATIQGLTGVAGSTVNLGASTLALNQTGTWILASTITDNGFGAFALQGSGTEILTGVNTYGGATVINGGTLAISAGGSIAASSGVNLTAAGTIFDISSGGNQTIRGLTGAAGSIVNLGGNTLALNQSGFSTFAGTIAGNNSSAFTLQGNGTEILTGVNTYTGPTIINGGTLALAGNGAIAASSGVNLTAAGTTFDISAVNSSATIRGLTGVSGSAVYLGGNTLTLNQTGTSTFAGTIADNGFGGAFTLQGSGTQILTGFNTYTGATVINGGTLTIGGGGSVALSSGVNLASLGTIFDISNGGSQTIQDLSGVAGSAVTLGPNILTLGTDDSTIFAGMVSGTGGLTKQGFGTLTLTGANTYSGGTTVTEGTLVGNTTSLQGNIVDNAAVAFNQTSPGTYAASLSGNGSLAVEGAGSLSLTGNSSAFAGNTLVTGGNLIIGPTATSGGSLGGSVTVRNGGLVAGHGTIGGSLANSSGVVASTGALVPLTIGGNYFQGSGGTLLVGLSPTAATKLAVGGSAFLSGTLDIATATGSYVPFSRFVILTAGSGVDGTFSQITGSFPPLPLTVLYQQNAVDLQLGGFTGITANENAVANVLNAAFPTATGDFATVLDRAVALPAAEMQQALSSFGGQLYGNLAEISLQDRRLFLGAMEERMRLFGGDSPSAVVLGSLGGGTPGVWAGSANATQLAALTDAINDAVSIAVPPGDIITTPPAGVNSPIVVPPGDVINSAVTTLDSPDLAPENPPSPPIADPVGTTKVPPAAAPVPSNVWARGFGQFGTIDSGNGTLGSGYSTGGGAIGAELINTPQALFGVAVSGGQSSVSLNTNPENGTIAFVQLGAYGATSLGYGLALDGAVIYAHDYYDVTRGIVLPGTSRVATSSHGGNDAVVDIGISRPYIVDNWQITPRAGLSYFHIGQSDFNESGAGSLDLAVNPDPLDALFSRIGVAFSETMMAGATPIIGELRGAWTHNFLDDHNQFNAAFIGTGAASFDQVGATIGRDAFDVGIGVSFAIAQLTVPAHLTGFIQYDATFASREFANAVAAGMRLKW